MGRFHVAKNTPTKLELLADWLPKQPWGPAIGEPLRPIGQFHFDDPEGEVGMQTHLIEAGGTLLQVPLAYRATPIAGAQAALVGEMHHSVLGPRFVYDGLGDSQFLMTMAAVTLAGYGQALGLAEHEGRWYAMPSEVRLEGGVRRSGHVAVDGLTVVAGDPARPRFRGDGFDLTYHRHPVASPRPQIGLSTTLELADTPVVLVEIQED